MAKEHATHIEFGLPVPDFAAAREALNPHTFSGPRWGWCRTCWRMKPDPLHTCLDTILISGDEDDAT